MARMRTWKIQLKQWLESPDWRERLSDIAAQNGREMVGPLLSFLLLGGDMTARAAVGAGVAVAEVAEREPDAARNILRRLMWHMNEESGNIGWGIPQAFAEILARSPRMAREFHRVLLSYIMDTGHDDNFCDHDVLRRSCFWAVGRLAQERPDLCGPAIPWLIRGLADRDIPCRGMAAWALAQLPPVFEAVPPLRRLAESGSEDVCLIFDGVAVREQTVAESARQALAHQAEPRRS